MYNWLSHTDDDGGASRESRNFEKWTQTKLTKTF